MKIVNQIHAVPSKGYNNSRIEKSRDGSTWIDIEVVTPWGYVTGYAQGDSKICYMTRLDFIHKRKQHVRFFRDKRYSMRGVKTKAMQFAREIVEGGAK